MAVYSPEKTFYYDDESELSKKKALLSHNINTFSMNGLIYKNTDLRLCSYACCLLNEAVSSTGCTAQNDRVIDE